MTLQETIAHAEPELVAATLAALKAYDDARDEYHRLLRLAVADSQKRQLASKTTWQEMSDWDRCANAMIEDEAMRYKRPVAAAGDYCLPVEYMSDGTARARPSDGHRHTGCAEGYMP